MNSSGLIKLLRSTRLSAWVLLILICLYVLGLIIPQKDILGGQGAMAFKQGSPVLYSLLDFIGFLDIYTSPLTVLMLLVFFVNLLIVFMRRTRRAVSQCAVTMPEALPGGSAAALVEVGEMDNDALMGRIRKIIGRFRFKTEGGRFIAVRNRYAPFGIIIFHLSFFLVLIGGLMLFYTRSDGDVVLTEGQDFRGGNWQSLRQPHLGGPPKVIFSVNDIRPQYKGDITVDMEVDIAVYLSPRPGDVEDFRVSVNNPAVYGPVSILISEVGISPLLRFYDHRGQRYEYAFVSLDVLGGKRDSMKIHYTDFSLQFEFYPDYVVRDGLESSASQKLNNPVFHVYFYEGSRLKWEGNVKPGDRVNMGPLNMEMQDLRYWGKFFVVKEWGRTPLILGFAMGVWGLVWRFFFNRTEVAGFREGRMLGIWVSGGQSRFSAELLRDTVAEKITDALEGRAGNV